MTKVYQGIKTDPGTGAHAIPVALAPTGALNDDNVLLLSQIASIDVGDGTAPKPLSDEFPMPVKAMPNASTVAAPIAQGLQTVASAGAPEALTDASTLVESVLIQACKGFNSPNTSPVFVGSASGDNANFLRLRPWETLQITAPRGEKIDLHQIFIDVVSNGDGVTFISIN